MLQRDLVFTIQGFGYCAGNGYECTEPVIAEIRAVGRIDADRIGSPPRVTKKCRHSAALLLIRSIITCDLLFFVYFSVETFYLWIQPVAPRRLTMIQSPSIFRTGSFVFLFRSPTLGAEVLFQAYTAVCAVV